MIYRIFPIIAWLFIFINSYSQIPSDGLVAYFPFNGNAIDESGNGNNGTVYGPVLTEDRCGIHHSAYYFDGVNDFIDLVPGPLLLENYTYSVWACPFTIPSYGTHTTMINIGKSIGSSDQQIGLFNNYSTIRKTGWGGTCYTSTKSPNGTATDEIPQVHEWYNIVLVKNSNLAKLFVNGELLDERALSGTTAYGDASAAIGRRTGLGRYFHGAIDDIRIFDRPLTDEEVKSLYFYNCSEITITGDEEVCQGETNKVYSLSSEIENVISYTWQYTGTGITLSGTNDNVSIDFAQGATSGNLSVIVEFSDGTKKSSEDFYVSVNPLPGAAGIINGNTDICVGENNVVYNIPEITNASAYVWKYSGEGAAIDGDSDIISINYSGDATEGYITVYGANACGTGQPSTLSVSVNPLPGSASDIRGENDVCLGQNGVVYHVPEINNASMYLWEYSGNGAIIIGNSNRVTISYLEDATDGYLTVYGANTCGIGESATMFIQVKPCEQVQSKLKIPNSFSPNGDDINDLFVIDGLAENTSITVFNRNGKKLYESNYYQNNWDGVDKDGNALPTGTYWYVLKIPGIQTAFEGFIYLKR